MLSCGFPWKAISLVRVNVSTKLVRSYAPLPRHTNRDDVFGFQNFVIRPLFYGLPSHVADLRQCGPVAVEIVF